MNPTPSHTESVPTPAFDSLRELLHERTSCRAFLDRPVPRGVIEQVLGAAQRTASWCNAQPWQG
ncbi:nitroreductase family protein [Variovorax paradoxus]|uniref:nitroreductase family protein n=1 Tax=Variovorax paradoxus TaxID=34073 RepID=UPI001ABBEAC6